jgi:small subunit ribosomal protein S4
MDKKSSRTEKQQSLATAPKRSPRKLTEFGKQLSEKQKLKRMYGMRERQFRRFYAEAVRAQGASGENLLSFLECRLDNVIYRLKFATSRAQARQMIVHGHVYINGKRVHSPSRRVHVGDVVALGEKVREKAEFLASVVDKRLKTGIKVPDWLELDKKNYSGQILRVPVRADIQAPVEEQLVVALYSR